MDHYHRRSTLIREQGPLLLLIGLMFIIWITQTLGPADWADSFMVVPANIAESWRHLRSGHIAPGDFSHFGTLLSYAFLHSDITHVGFNMLYLWIFAALIVEHLGQGWFILIFILTAIGGGIAHALLGPTDIIPMLGASGAVMGFEGAYLGLALSRQLPDPHVWPMSHPIPPMQLAALAVVGALFDFHDILIGQADFIAHGAHIGGFITGLFITSIALPASAGRHTNY